MLEMENEPLFILCGECDESFAEVFHSLPKFVECPFCKSKIYFDDMENM